MKRYSNFSDFVKDFSTSEACFAYLFERKWKDGYQCTQCGNKSSIKGRKQYYKRCKKCGYDESPTANTLFHKLKFPIEKAFMIIYQLSTMKKGMSSCEISRQYGIHQETAWFFKRKVQLAMKSQGFQLLSDNVEVDETVIGGRELGKPGRSLGRKKRVQVAVEVEYPQEGIKAQIKRAFAVPIEDFTTGSLKKGINQMVDKQALITTDGWPAYAKAVDQRQHDVLISNAGENFQQLHWHIFNLKNWIRGIHHSISLDHLGDYLAEFYYRFNRRNATSGNTENIIDQMLKVNWHPYQKLKAS